MPDKSLDRITGKSRRVTQSRCCWEAYPTIYGFLWRGQLFVETFVCLSGVCVLKNICCDLDTLPSCSLALFSLRPIVAVCSELPTTIHMCLKPSHKRCLVKCAVPSNAVASWRQNCCFHQTLSLPGQTDQTHQAAAGGEWGAPVHQSAADTEGDDDKRTGLRGEGIYTCCFHHPPVAVPTIHPHVR